MAPMICLGCGFPTSNCFCNGCLEVLDQDGDRWTFNHPEDVALRDKILDAQCGYLAGRDLGDEGTGAGYVGGNEPPLSIVTPQGAPPAPPLPVHDDTLDKGECPHCMKYALDSALQVLGRAIRGAT